MIESNARTIRIGRARNLQWLKVGTTTTSYLFDPEGNKAVSPREN